MPPPTQPAADYGVAADFEQCGGNENEPNRRVHPFFCARATDLGWGSFHPGLR